MTRGFIYRVDGPRGIYFAVHDPATGRVWTERSEHAAKSQAAEMRLEIESVLDVTHDEMLRRTGRDTARTVMPPPKPPAAPPPESPDRMYEVQQPLSSRAAFPSAMNDESVLISRADSTGAPFAAEGVVTPDDAEESESSVEDDIVVRSRPQSASRPAKRATRSSPFAQDPPASPGDAKAPPRDATE